MAKRVNHGVELIKTAPATDRGGSRPKPPKAVARLEATQPVADHEKAKRRLTAKTVAFYSPRRLPHLPRHHMPIGRGLQTQMLAQRCGLVLPPEQPPPLQLRRHKLDEILS
jgi:hypothetical protein